MRFIYNRSGLTRFISFYTAIPLVIIIIQYIRYTNPNLNTQVTRSKDLYILKFHFKKYAFKIQIYQYQDLFIKLKLHHLRSIRN